ncbi:MAG: adenylate kinase family protein [Candidatus Thorarchaeota archaeon]|jgi:adenylate kinase
MSVILVGGTPGTGKTKVAKILGSKLSVEVISLGIFADESGCITAEDKARNTGIINEDCLVDALIELTEDKSKRIVIEGHYIDLVPSSSVQWVFILRTHPGKLRTRLSERNYSNEKVTENVEAEVMGVCQMDALNAFSEAKVFEIDTSELSAPQTAEKIDVTMKNKSPPTRIDWMSQLEEQGRLDEFLSD